MKKRATKRKTTSKKLRTQSVLEEPPKRPLVLPRGECAEALAHLKKCDPKMGKLIEKVGPFRLKSWNKGEPYNWLLRSILYQQLHGRAAATIHARLQALFGGRDPSPEEFLAADEEAVLKAGLSRSKKAAIYDLSKAAVEGRVPTKAQMKRMNDEDIVKTLLPIRGIGRWTVEMLLIFGLRRADVLAVDDFALGKSVMLLHNFPQMPKRQTFKEFGLIWKPWRTVASWYLWRALDTPANN